MITLNAKNDIATAVVMPTDVDCAENIRRVAAAVVAAGLPMTEAKFIATLNRLRSEGKLIYVSARTDIVLSSNLN